jgi:hypothetical protein
MDFTGIFWTRLRFLEQLVLFVGMTLVCGKICHSSDTLEEIRNILKHVSQAQGTIYLARKDCHHHPSVPMLKASQVSTYSFWDRISA